MTPNHRNPRRRSSRPTAPVTSTSDERYRDFTQYVLGMHDDDSVRRDLASDFEAVAVEEDKLRAERRTTDARRRFTASVMGLPCRSEPHSPTTRATGPAS